MNRCRYFSRFFLFLGVAFLYTATTSAQMKFNEHNPYVTNGEIHHLKKMGIDLFDKPITDADFQKNVRRTLDLRSQFNDDNSKYAAIGISSLILLTTGLAGVIMSQADLPPSNGFYNIVYNTEANLRTEYLLLGSAGVITAAFAIKARSKRNKSRSKFEQQLEVTRNQYSLLR